MLQTCKDLAVEAAWRLARPAGPPLNYSWSPDSDWAASARIIWPTRYQWAPTRKWVEPLRRALRRLIPLESHDLPQPYPGIVLFDLVVAGTSTTIAIDCSDKPTINTTCVDCVPVYFKMQYSSRGYPWPHVVPGGFGPADSSVYQFLPRLRALASRAAPIFDVYGRFGLQFASDLRREAIGRLADAPEIRYAGGAGIVRYSRFLREVAMSKVCINLPGNGDLCFRLMDYFAVGACIIGPKLENTLNAPLVDRVHIVYTKDDLSDLVPLCRQYVEDDRAREAIRHNARQVFDRFLSSDQLAAYYLHECRRWLEPVEREVAAAR